MYPVARTLLPGSNEQAAPRFFAPGNTRKPKSASRAMQLFPPQIQEQEYAPAPPPENDLPQDPIKITSNFVGVHWHRGASKLCFHCFSALDFFSTCGPHVFQCITHTFFVFLGKWVAQISLGNKRTHLGYFKTEHEAAVRYDKTASEHGR